MTSPAKTPRAARILIPAAYLFAALALCLPLFFAPLPDATGRPVWQRHNLMFDSHERLHFVIRLSELHDAVRAGQWPARWCPNLMGGFGYPFFEFYAPLSYYLADVWHWTGLDLYRAWKLHFLLMFFCSALFMYFYARLFFDWPAALLAGLLYQCAPYHLLNLYVRGNVAEFTAMTWLPLLLYFFHRLAREPRRPALLSGSVSCVALLILSHNIFAQFSAIFLLGYLLALGVAARIRREHFPWPILAGAGGAGMLLAAFFWLPALLELKYCQLQNLTQTFDELPQHTVHFLQFFGNNWGFGLSEIGAADDLSFSLGPAHWLLLAVSCGWLTKAFFANHFSVAGKRDGALRATCAHLLALLVLLVLMLPAGVAVLRWRPLATIQFPWRLLAFAALSISFAGAYGVHRIAVANARAGMIALALAILLLAGFTFDKARPAGFFPQPAALYQPVNTRRQFTSTNNEEFLPVWAGDIARRDESIRVSHRRILDRNGKTAAVIAPNASTAVRFRITLDMAQKLVYEQFYFPGWRAYCDGTPVECVPEKSSGWIEFAAQAGNHEYRVELGQSPARRWGNLLSVSGLLLLIALLLWQKKSVRQQPQFLTRMNTDDTD